MEINGIPQAFVKMAKTFQYYYILAAGHMVKHYLDQNTEKVWKNADFNRTVHVLCCPIRIFSTFVTVDLVTYTRLSHSSPQGGLSLGFHIRVVPHQWSHIRVVSDQAGLSLGWPLIRMVSRHGGLSSGWSCIRVVSQSHQDYLSSWWSLIRMVSHHFYLLYSVILLSAGSSRQRACCTDGAETRCWGITRSTISTAVFLGFILSCGCIPSATAVWVSWCCEGWSTPAAMFWLCWFISVVLSDFSISVHVLIH